MLMIEKRDPQAPELEEHGPHALARDDLKAARLEHQVLQVKDDAGGDDQDGGEHRPRPDGREAAGALVDLFVDLRRDVVDADLGPEDGGDAEVGQGVERDQQRPGEDARHDEGDGDLAGDGEKPGPGDPGRFLQGGVHPLQGSADLDEDEGEQVHRLHGDDAREAVDVEDRGSSSADDRHQDLVDVTRPGRKEHLPRQGADEGRQHEGHQEEELHRPLEGQVRPGDEPGEKDADDGAEKGHPGRDDDRVPAGPRRCRPGRGF